MDYQKKRDQLEMRHQNELKRIELEREIFEAIESAGIPEPRYIYPHGIPKYGYSAGISYGDKFNNALGLDEVDAITGKLPPVDLAYAECTSYKYFIPLEYEDQFCENVPQCHTFIQCYPYWFEIDGYGAKLSYYADLGGRLISVALTVSTNRYYGALHLTGRVKTFGGSTVISLIENRDVEHSGRSLHYLTLDIYNNAGEWLGQTERKIQYAPGSRDAWHSAKIWANLCSDHTPSARAFLETLYNK